MSMADLQHSVLISGNKAMQLLELSRHSFEKVVKDRLLTVVQEGGKRYYQIGEIESFMGTDTYQELVNGVVDPRNSLNDLTGKEWLPQTKSFFYQKGLGANHPEAQIEKLHPAPFSFQDVGKLIPNDRAEVTNLMSDFKTAFGCNISIMDLRTLLTIAVTIVYDGKTFDISELNRLEGFANATLN